MAILPPRWSRTSVHLQIEDLLKKALGQLTLSPAFAAAIASCVRQNDIRIAAFEGDADVLLADVHLHNTRGQIEGTEKTIRRMGVRDPWNPELSDHYEFRFLLEEIVEQATVLDSLLPELESQFQDVAATQHTLFATDQLCERFALERTDTGIYIPNSKQRILTEAFQEVVRAAERDRATLLRMSPRGFEEFMADVFKSLGFEVELTASSRDGGADLLCLNSTHGVPFRLAVEVKRYKETRPISVELVRSFVGANRELNANRLLYVTTSSYTKPAHDFATNFAGHILSLKQYEDIQDWCRYCLTNPPKILGANANLLP